MTSGGSQCNALYQVSLILTSVLTASIVRAQGPFGSSFGGSDLLPAEQAFTVSHPKANVIEISIADGTYLYDERTIVQERRRSHT